MGKPPALLLPLAAGGRAGGGFSPAASEPSGPPPVPFALPKRRAESDSREPERALFSEMMPTKTPRKQNSASTEGSVAIALQLRKIGDKWNLRQRILNLISKLFCPGT